MTCSCCKEDAVLCLQTEKKTDTTRSTHYFHYCLPCFVRVGQAIAPRWMSVRFLSAVERAKSHKVIVVGSL